MCTQRLPMDYTGKTNYRRLVSIGNGKTKQMIVYSKSFVHSEIKGVPATTKMSLIMPKTGRSLSFQPQSMYSEWRNSCPYILIQVGLHGLGNKHLSTHSYSLISIGLCHLQFSSMYKYSRGREI